MGRSQNDPQLDILKQLLSQDSEARNLPYVPRLGSPGGEGGLMGSNPPADSLQSFSREALMGHQQTAQDNSQMDVMRALRGVIERRTPDDAARGPQAPQDPAQGKTTAEKQGDTIFGIPNPLKALTDALFGANNPGQ